MSERPCIVWFRNDLRLADNPALFHAAAKGQVIPVYIWDEINPGEWAPGAASRCWLHHALNSLNRNLAGALRIFSGNPEQIIQRLVDTTQARGVYWNRCYQPWAIKRDKHLKQQLCSCDIEVKSFNGSLLWEPWTVNKPDRTHYKVFTPFFNKGCRNATAPRLPYPKPQPLRLNYSSDLPEQKELNELKLLDNRPWAETMSSHWDITETGASLVMQRFISERLEYYSAGRDFPAQENTSYLSPYLAHGLISPNQVWHHSLQQAIQQQQESQLIKFQQELGWREFSYYQLFHNPHITDANLNEKFNRFPWRDDPDQQQIWQQGNTGFPMIDAGMRQLWQTGYMHNRVRMIVASFLVKNQLQHWIHGARWFWDTLVDADLASNSASWQWVAGCGADAAPYFRIFNPVTQGEKFDPEGDYIRQYVPELSTLPNRYIHKPWEAPQEALQQAGITLGKEYPAPILDLKTSRQAALNALEQTKEPVLEQQ